MEKQKKIEVKRKHLEIEDQKFFEDNFGKYRKIWLRRFTHEFINSPLLSALETYLEENEELKNEYIEFKHLFTQENIIEENLFEYNNFIIRYEYMKNLFVNNTKASSPLKDCLNDFIRLYDITFLNKTTTIEEQLKSYDSCNEYRRSRLVFVTNKIINIFIKIQGFRALISFLDNENLTKDDIRNKGNDLVKYLQEYIEILYPLKECGVDIKSDTFNIYLTKILAELDKVVKIHNDDYPLPFFQFSLSTNQDNVDISDREFMTGILTKTLNPESCDLIKEITIHCKVLEVFAIKENFQVKEALHHIDFKKEYSKLLSNIFSNVIVDRSVIIKKNTNDERIKFISIINKYLLLDELALYGEDKYFKFITYGLSEVVSILLVTKFTKNIYKKKKKNLDDENEEDSYYSKLTPKKENEIEKNFFMEKQNSHFSKKGYIEYLDLIFEHQKEYKIMLGVHWAHYLGLTYLESTKLLYNMRMFRDRKPYDEKLNKIDTKTKEKLPNLYFTMYNKFLTTFYPNYRYLKGISIFNHKDSSPY